MSIPLVALVGRPNVGKSTLFNRLLRERRAVVSEIAGTTRDRLEGTVRFAGREARIVDMAGIEPALKAGTEIAAGMQEQVGLALAEADLILWTVDAREGVTGQDETVAELLRRLGKPVVVAANKADAPQHEEGRLDFMRFGFDAVPVSALHGRGTEELGLAIAAALPPEAGFTAGEEEAELKLAIVGRPNVGKSTLLNALTGERRAVVSPIAGTTRDTVDERLDPRLLFGSTPVPFKAVRIVDTAGIRRRGKIDRHIEGWSVLRTYGALESADVALFLIDAVEALVHQDLQVAERIVESGRPLVIIVNKWDLQLRHKAIEAGSKEDDEEQARWLGFLRRDMPFLLWAPVVFASASEGINVRAIGVMALAAYQAWCLEPDPAELQALADHLKGTPRLKSLIKITYEHARPPVFHLHVHGETLPHFSTVRMIENALRDVLEIGPTPIKIWTVTQKAGKRG